MLMTTSTLSSARAFHRRTTVLGVSISVGARTLAIGSYFVLAWAVIGHLFTAQASPTSAMRGASDSTTPAAQFVPGTWLDARPDVMPVPTTNSAVLTITVDGPHASVDVYCDPTNEGTSLDHVHVTPSQMMDTFQRLCSPLPDS